MLYDPSRFLLVVFSIETAFQTHARDLSGAVVADEREVSDPLLDVVQFWS